MYLWKIPDDYPESLLGQYDRTKGPDRFVYKRGEPLRNYPAKPPSFEFCATADELRQLHDLGNNALVPLVSAAIAQILTEVCPDDIQLISASIRSLDENIDDYSIVVITHQIRGLDHKRSQYTCIPGTESLMGLKRAVYFEGCLGAYEAARDSEFLSNLLISESLFEALKGHSGIGLYPVEV